MMSLVENIVYTCQYCKNKFSKEKTLSVHICEQKRRALAKTEKHVMLGYDTYNRFYRKTQNSKQDKTYEDFAKSPYYNAFVKFGSFVSNVNPLYPDRFIDWIVVSGVKLDHWCRDELYEKYVLDLIRVETVETALQRSITHMMKWGEDNKAEWNHYFHYVSINRACYDIRDGKISPWLILNSTSGKTMLQKFNDEQLASVGSTIDPQFWMHKFKKLPADVELVKQVVRESNI
jgi:hypothetical protein